MRINLASMLVSDQAKALEFYTAKLGFEKRTMCRWANSPG